MVFSSLLFIFVFLPIFLLVYYLLPHRWRNLFIVIGGYFFYSWGAPKFAIILFFTITVDYLISLYLVKIKSSHKKYLLIASIILNLGLLAYFKYSNFFIGQINWLLVFTNLPSLPWKEVILPIGISFIVFQELSYIIDVYRGNIKPARTLIDFAAFLMLFPQIIAGPIIRYIDVCEQLKSRVYNIDNFYYGIKRFSIGLSKKILIANTISPVADAMFHLNSVRDLSSPLAWLGILSYSIQIYFDFSGYSDMAIGMAKMLGFDFKENFNRPYIAKSVTDFWTRWHISLSTWMKEYLYIPLGGNRISPKRTYINLWIVFLISGLWHGANWSFILWGAFHGFLLVNERIFLLKWLSKIPKYLQIGFTFFVINLSWVLFREENLSLAMKFYIRLFSLGDFFKPINIRMHEIINTKQIIVFIIAMLIIFIPWKKISKQNIYNKKTEIFLSLFNLGLFILAILELFNSKFNPFIYFRF